MLREKNKKKLKIPMREDPNELHVAIENKSIKVGGFSTEEQLYEFCGGMMLAHSFLLLMCLSVTAAFVYA